MITDDDTRRKLAAVFESQYHCDLMGPEGLGYLQDALPADWLAWVEVGPAGLGFVAVFPTTSRVSTSWGLGGEAPRVTVEPCTWSTLSPYDWIGGFLRPTDQIGEGSDFCYGPGLYVEGPEAMAEAILRGIRAQRRQGAM